jgi:hypothetical protein
MQTRDMHGHAKEGLNNNIHVWICPMFSKKFVQGGIFETNQHLVIVNMGMDDHMLF